MELRGMNDRIKKLRRQNEETTPCIFIERTMLMTGTCKKYEGEVSIPELRALSMKEVFSHKTITIEGGELIVGDKGAGPQSTPIFPELCRHMLEDMEVINDRELICFKASDEDMRQQEGTIILFWEKRSIRHKIINSTSQEWEDCYEAGIFAEFMKQRGPGHTVGSEKIYAKGFLDYQQDTEEAIAAIDSLSDSEAIEGRDRLCGMSIMCDATMILKRCYAVLAKEPAEKESDPVCKEELLQIAANCNTVPAHRLRTYWQVVRTCWLIHLGVTTELNPQDAYSPGRLDQHLSPFYEANIEVGHLDKSKAEELLECLWVELNNQPIPPKMDIALKGSPTYTDFANINTGGVTSDGEDGVSDVSYLILDVTDGMKLPQSSSSVQISKKTPMKLIKRACEISRKGWGQLAFYNVEAIIQELLNAGKSTEDVRRGEASGCVETGASGREVYILQGYFNLPKVLEVTLHSGWDPIGGEQLGLRLGEAEDFKSYDELFDAYKKQIEHFVDIKVKRSGMITRVYAKYMPAPFFPIVTDDYITNGKDCNAGGTRYNMNHLQGVGIRTVADSSFAIEYNVYGKKNFTMDELMRVLQDNFEGEEHVRPYNLVSHKTPKYGNDDDYAGAVMKKVFTSYKSMVTGYPNMCNGQWKINMLPTVCRVYLGEVMLASPNSRLAHKPVSEGISPEKAVDVNGPVSVICSASRMGHLSTGGVLLNQKFIPGVVVGEDGPGNMADLIRSYFNMDGHHVRFSVIDCEILIKA